MKKFFRLGRALSPWLALATPFLLLGILAVLRALAPGLFCVAMNSKEFVCGGDYSHPGIRVFRLTGLFVWVLVFIAGGAELARSRGRNSEVIAWSLSGLLLVSLTVFAFFFPADSCP